MRGIEGALKVLVDVERGMFASESLRRAQRDIEPAERKLAASLVYITLRRRGLWRHLLGRYCRRPVSSLGSDTLLSLEAGIAGVLELQHFKPGVLVNALVQMTKNSPGSSGDASLVNAVLHSVMESAPPYVEKLRNSAELRDQALGFGVPGWVASAWAREWGMKDAKRLIGLTTANTFTALRASPGTDRNEWASSHWPGAALSETAKAGILLDSNPYPPELPGYGTGQVTPQTESSMIVSESLLEYWRGGALLDMCMGRGVKAGHILSFCPGASAEGWDTSAPKLRSAEREFGRLGISGERFRTVCGDALSLVPSSAPSAILLDAPCSGSGTWGRHPDGKWKISPANVERMAELQKLLLSRACDIISPGGIIIYCTCSVFRGENENVAGSVMALRQDMAEMPLKAKSPAFRRGKPYGTVILPESPWMDGFYIVILKKKNSVAPSIRGKKD
ncbi:MAG: RsmB/NOP family class I SAM-dependent RNA methyltransferase [Synergistaceae bacterium]|jgi:16S rRNA (cytosine967-C5)-methyltransferase|nr:RsmB/NOP family class I SAM-dependent RNA methyltransferase [Synergistaceae bacterium]